MEATRLRKSEIWRSGLLSALGRDLEERAVIFLADFEFGFPLRTVLEASRCGKGKIRPVSTLNTSKRPSLKTQEMHSMPLEVSVSGLPVEDAFTSSVDITIEFGLSD